MPWSGMSCQARACMPTIRPCRCSPRVRSGRRRGGCGRICDTGGPLRGDVAPAVLHRYNPDRKSDHPRLHLAGFTGVLHADGYSGFASPTLKSAADTGRLHWDRTQRDNTRIQSGRQSSRPHAPISAMMAKSVDLGWSEFSQCRRQS